MGVESLSLENQSCLENKDSDFLLRAVGMNNRKVLNLIYFFKEYEVSYFSSF
jgi:hypothetical protein